MPLETFQPGDMNLGTFPVMTRKITVASGAGELKRGTVLGRVTANDKFLTAIDGAGDGSETPECILAADIDATAADVDTLAYYTGGYDASKLTFGAGITVAIAETAFAKAGRSIFLKELV
ncbi:head decoration protein [Chelativorans sp. YIM 93263]|uniref:head decoration protein n=1 Tax=Chelativorans sp. YIM 93263 TaxID=2906648 RepID=UPI00237967CA|nr:head decoration protein [Chelativorans sp. YIM 93263]